MPAPRVPGLSGHHTIQWHLLRARQAAGTEGTLGQHQVVHAAANHINVAEDSGEFVHDARTEHDAKRRGTSAARECVGAGYRGGQVVLPATSLTLNLKTNLW